MNISATLKDGNVCSKDEKYHQFYDHNSNKILRRSKNFINISFYSINFYFPFEWITFCVSIKEITVKT